MASEVLDLMIVSGVYPSETIEITDHIRLMSLSEAPDCPLRNTYLPGMQPGKARVLPHVRAALVRRTGFEITEQQDSLPTTADWHQAHLAMVDIPRALTIASQRPILRIAWGFQVEGYQIPQVEGLGGWGGMWQYEYRSLRELQPENLDADRIRSLVHAYTALPKDFRAGLETAIDRLAMVPSHPWWHERAMDLGIALEAALWAGDTTEYHGELRHRFTARGTILRGGTAEERRATAKLLKDFYGIRSRVAHGGQSPHENPKEIDVISQCIELSFDFIERLIRLGRSPDWDGLTMGWAQL